MSHLSPSAIFSPSVARQAAAAAKDWSYVDAWLSRTFTTIGKSPPPFERNPETLKALLALVSYNEAADEDRDLVCAVKRKALGELTAEEREQVNQIGENADVIVDLEHGLSKEGLAALDALAEASVAVDLPYTDDIQLAKRIMDLQVDFFDLEQASDRVATLQRHLERELESVTQLVEELQSDAYQQSSEISKQTLEYQRKSKVLAAKLPELKDRAAALSAASGEPKPTIQDIKRDEDKYRQQMAVVRELEKQVKSYHGLPHDVDLARLELESLRVELKDLMRQRDRMFEGLVERESPKKSRPRP